MLTRDHKPTDEEEESRIVQVGICTPCKLACCMGAWGLAGACTQSALCPSHHASWQTSSLNLISCCRMLLQAGGWVSHSGRVNSDLDMSRSLGDMSLKQVGVSVRGGVGSCLHLIVWCDVAPPSL